MKLYMFPVAPNPTKVRLYLAEKKLAGTEIPVEEIMVSLPEGQQKSAEHVKRNPLGKVPVLELDDGTYLTESLPMMLYLEELYADPPMIGTTPQARAQTLNVERIAEQGVLFAMAKIVHATDSPLGLPKQPEVAEHFRKVLIGPCKILDDRLSDGRPFLMGDTPTIADFTLAAGLQMGRFKELEPDPALEHLARWSTAYRERPAAKQVLIL
ncbi:MAG: glutathione S-transferase family protein [Candidatus Binatia bacterium]|nr:glutathione S-transferase family protein [Candidatus Binatia bacterium]